MSTKVSAQYSEVPEVPCLVPVVFRCIQCLQNMSKSGDEENIAMIYSSICIDSRSLSLAIQPLTQHTSPGIYELKNYMPGAMLTLGKKSRKKTILSSNGRPDLLVGTFLKPPWHSRGNYFQ